MLAHHPDSSLQILAVVKRMLTENRTAGSVRDTIKLSLAWSIIPELGAAITPPPAKDSTSAGLLTATAPFT